MIEEIEEKEFADSQLQCIVERVGDKFCCKIKLKTTDGQVTSMESGFIYDTEKEASDILEHNVARVLKLLKEQGCEVLAKNGTMLQ